ncbi:hypothetical protein MTO96_025569 [Rhipicephalus appendiculatus]
MNFSLMRLIWPHLLCVCRHGAQSRAAVYICAADIIQVAKCRWWTLRSFKKNGTTSLFPTMRKILCKVCRAALA